MTLSRRKTLGLIGGGVVLAVAAPATAFLTTRTPTRALEPWDLAGGYAEPRMRALSYALLAPNPHNRQPWQAELRGDDVVAIWRDPARDLPVTDPFGRQLTIGMGCFLDLMDMAAGEDGFGVETTLYPEGEDGPVAVCRFVPGAGATDPLFTHVLNRRSHKEAFEPRTVAAAAVAGLAPHARIVRDPGAVASIAELAEAAWLVEMTTPAALQESVDLLRIGRREIEASPDGIDLGGPMMETLALAGLLSREAAGDPDNPGTARVIEETRAAIVAAPAFAVQVTQGNSRAEQIATGRDWLRLNLAATGAGLALRPVSQALQEYPEMEGILAATHALLAPDGGTVQMLGLLGYGRPTPRTPRWPLETRMSHA